MGEGQLATFVDYTPVLTLRAMGLGLRRFGSQSDGDFQIPERTRASLAATCHVPRMTACDGRLPHCFPSLATGTEMALRAEPEELEFQTKALGPKPLSSLAVLWSSMA